MGWRGLALHLHGPCLPAPQPGQALRPGPCWDGAAALCLLGKGKPSQNRGAVSGDQWKSRKDEAQRVLGTGLRLHILCVKRGLTQDSPLSRFFPFCS